MSLDRKITDLLPSQIPDYVQEFYPLFVIFITKYYEWLEAEGNPQNIIQNITLNRDIDTTASSLASKFTATYAPNLPQTSELDRAVLVKNFRDFYRAKGSEKSFEFFFRAFFDDEVSVKLPGDQLFKTSDGVWYVEKTLRVSADVGSPEDLLHTTVTGSISGATAVIEKATKTYGKWDLTLQDKTLVGTFNSSETITGYYWDFVNDVSSLVSVTNTAPLNIAAGRQIGTNSLLSSDQKMQDSTYWQKFSYVVRTRINLDRWKDAVLEQIHPTGRNMFGEVYVDNASSITVTSTFVNANAIETSVRLFGDSSQFYVVPGVTWDRVADFQTGTSETTTAGAITYDAAYDFSGENVTFALQSPSDAATTYIETLAYTSITGTISVDVTTASTALYRDIINYVMPVTSITGTINSGAQVGGEEVTFTGTSTVFAAEMPVGNIWRHFDGTLDAGQNPVYKFYSSVLTIRDLEVTGTLTIAAQTPVGPDYYIYATGVGTQFRSDLLVAGAGSSESVSAETDRPVIDRDQPPVLIKINNMPVTGDITFNAGQTTATAAGAAFIDQMISGNTITITKPLSGRLTQIDSIPATNTSYITTFTVTTDTETIYGSSLTSSFTTSQASATYQASTYGRDRSARYDITAPFPIKFLSTSTSSLYLHAYGVLSSSSSSPFNYYTSSPAKDALIVTPNYSGTYTILNKVWYGTLGTAPNRQFKVCYEGQQSRPYWSPFDQTFYEDTSNVLRVASLGTAITAMTTGTATNGYRTFTLPWTIYYQGIAVSSIHVTHNSRVAFGTVTVQNKYTLTPEKTLNEIPRRSAWETTPTDEDDINYHQNSVGWISLMTDTGLWSDGVGGTADPDAQKMIKLYQGTVGTAPNRSHIIRYEGNSSTAATAGQLIWEMEFKESNLSSITVHSGATTIGTYYYDINYQSYYYTTVPYYVVLVQGSGGLYSDFYPYANRKTSNYLSSSQSTTIGYGKDYLHYNPPHVWEATFNENSSSGITVAINSGQRESFYGTYRYNYGQSAGTTYRSNIEFSESNGTLPSGRVYGNNLTTSGYYYEVYDPTFQAYNYKFNRINALPAIYSSSTVSSAGLVLAMMANQSNLEAEPYYDYSTKLASTFDTVPSTITSSGAVARWTRDGYNATSSTGTGFDPNPTCSSYAKMAYTWPVVVYTGGGGGGYGGK